ncbi:MAG: alpha/beta fold hydrolase [Acidobacteriota bacterium]
MQTETSSHPTGASRHQPGMGTTADTSEAQVTFEALDGATLVGTLFEPEGPPHTVLLVNSGTGIPRRFYFRFARHAAAQGFAVLTYDYRGIGGSAPDSLRGYEASYRHWGQRDVPGAIAFLTGRFPGLPLTVIGHSTGGQQLGLARNVSEVDAAVFIAVSTGYWGGTPWHYKLLSLGLWKGYFPLATRILGYAPAKKIRWGENLPAGVAREWGAWCMEPDYLAAFFDEGGRLAPPDGEPFGPVHFDEVTFPVRAYAFTDDPIATRANVPPMLSLFDRAELETKWVEPSSLGMDEIGHLGFFRQRIGQPLWDDALGWLRTASHRVG